MRSECNQGKALGSRYIVLGVLIGASVLKFGDRLG